MSGPPETITHQYVPPPETVWHKERPTHKPPKTHAESGPFGYLTFQGIGFTTHKERQFDVLCGDQPPTITGGYANWANIPRPLLRSLTVFQGYDPVTMTCDVRFGAWGNLATGGIDIFSAWQTSDQAGKLIESRIADLEWMGGSNFRAGPSPVIYVRSFSPKGGQTDLIPPQYRGIAWVCSGLTWGTAIRNNSGYRIWQEAQITLLNYLNFTKPPQETTNERGGYFTSRPGKDTALRIAASPSAHSPAEFHRILANRIIADPHNKKLKLRSIKQKIKHGQKVWVPQHAI